VIGGLGLTGAGFLGYLPLLVAFAVLATFTHSSGLRAPASIAIVKDLLIYVTTFTVVIYVPLHLGGFGKIFAAVPPESCCCPPPARTARVA